MGFDVIKLAILSGHLPKGLIRCKRSICRGRSNDSYSLCRKEVDGTPAVSYMHSFGNFHFETSKGPIPASIVEITSKSRAKISFESIARLHAISLGYPVLGETRYIRNEKFYNPVVQGPNDIERPLIQNWIGTPGTTIQADELSGLLVDFHQDCLQYADSHLIKQLSEFQSECSEFDFQGETSSCLWVDHPSSVSVRRDRCGKTGTDENHLFK